MFSSLRFRLWLSYALVVGVVIGIVGVVLLFFLIRNPFEYASRQEIQRLNLISLLIDRRGEVLGGLTGLSSPQRLQTALEQADQTLNARILITDSQGGVLFDSRSGNAARFQAFPLPGTLRASGAPVIRDSSGKAWLYVERSLQGGNLLIVAAPRPRTPVLAILRDDFVPPISRAAGLALFLSLLLAIWVARWVAAPLRRMADAARSVAASNLSGDYRPIPLEGPKEVQTLGSAFNEMTSRVLASQQSQRDFVANVSHELKTPLTSIQGFAQAILDGTVDTPEALNQAAQVIYSESGRMHRLVLDLLDLARLDSGIAGLEQAPVDLSALLQGLVDKFAPLARQAQVTLRVNVGSLPVIQGDADRLAQVFTNLVDNALKHTPAGGQVDLHARQVDSQVEVSVADGGQGIPPEELERIFERFYQTDKSRSGGDRRGVGLGLAISREIVQAHGGKISALNKKDMQIQGQGSIFVVKLPLAYPGEAAWPRQKTENTPAA